MSFDGPCSVLRAGMHGFPFNNNDGRVSRGQLHQQRHVRQQHQPAGTFALGQGTTRRTSAERKVNTEPSYTESCPDNLSTTFMPGAGSGNVWDVGDDSLPPLIDTPRLRSVSSLVLSSDGEGECLSAVEHSTGYSKLRSGRDQSSGWSNILEGLATSFPPLSQASTSLGLSSPSAPVSTQRLQREPSFPPPNMPSTLSRPISREPSFPPLHEPSMLGSQALVSESLPQWRAASQLPGCDGDVLGVNTNAGVRTGGSGAGIGGGEANPDSPFQRFASGDISEEHGRSLVKDQWEAGDSTGVVSCAGGEVIGSKGLYPIPPSEPDRKPSFDQLALLIPGVPQRFNPPQTESEEKQRSPEAVKVSAVPRGRPTSRQDSLRRRSKGEDGTRGNGRSGRQRSSGKLEDAPGSAGPPSTNGGPVDLAKKARREAAIKRYIYKKSRRKFADSTREASPSRSRPKAARIRPRKFGKFIKTVPDFIPVTAVVPEGNGEGEQKPIMDAAIMQSPGIGGGMGGFRDFDSGLKTELLDSIGTDNLYRASFPQVPKSPHAAVGTSSVNDGFMRMWATTSM